MPKSVKQRAAELVEALTSLQQAAEKWAETPNDKDYTRVRAAQEISDRAVAWTQTVQRTMKGGDA